MKMIEDDYRIRSVSSNEVMSVVSYFSGIALEWPPLIQYKKTDETYKFVSNEVIEDWMIGNYSGHAKYILIE